MEHIQFKKQQGQGDIKPFWFSSHLNPMRIINCLKEYRSRAENLEGTPQKLILSYAYPTSQST